MEMCHAVLSARLRILMVSALGLNIVPMECKKSSRISFLVQIASHWKIIGTMLKVPQGTLNAIDQDNIRSCQKAAIEMFSTWIKLKCSPCTWNNLLQVLRSQIVGERRLAELTTDKVLKAS